MDYPIKKLDRDYFNSNRWRCQDSPSGAHCWLVVDDSQKCQFCDEVKEAQDFYTWSFRRGKVKRSRQESSSKVTNYSPAP